MEKRTLSQFVWTIIMLMILSIIVIISTPLGRSLSNAFINEINDFTLRMKVFMPIDYSEVVQEGDWEYIVVGATNSDSSEFTEADRDDVGMLSAIQLTKYTGKTTRQITVPNIFIDGTGKKHVVVSVGGLNDGEEYDEDKARVFSDENKKIKNIVVSQGVDIGVGAFNSLNSLKTVIIADKCAVINDYAFAGCGKLQNVRCGTDNEFIGSYAFANCISLNNVHFGDKLNSIGDFAFYNCSAFTPIAEFPDSLYQIGNYAFANCESFKTLNLKNTLVERIGDFAFSKCIKITGTIYLPDTLKYLGNNAFEDCKQISGQLVIPENLEYIGINCFKNVKFNKIDFLKNTAIKAIMDSAFMNCSTMRGSLIFPSTLKYIGPNAFYGCTSISNIVLNEGIEFIGTNAFYSLGNSLGYLRNCNLVIPASCEYLGGNLTYNYDTNVVAFSNTNNINAFDRTNFKSFIIAEGNSKFTLSGPTTIIFK